MARLARIAGLVALALALLEPAPGAGQAYPAKPVRIIVPFPAGGTADILSRALGQRLAERMGQPFVIENRPGAGTAIGSEAVARSAPDGYTLLMGTVSSHAINPSVNPRVAYDPIRDFTAVTAVASLPFILVVHPSVPASTLGELIALARSQPGRINYASAGIGTSNHLAGELFKISAALDIVHVAYRGSAPALVDVIAGHVQMMFDLSATALPHIQGKAVRGLAITSRNRSPSAPDLPTMIEGGLPEFEATAWFGVFAPAGLPPEIAERLHAEIAAALATPQLSERLAQQGADRLSFGAPAEFAAFVRAERERWAKVVKDANVTAD